MTHREIDVEDVLYAHRLWRAGPDTLANRMARNMDLLVSEIKRLRIAGAARRRASLERAVEFLEGTRDDLWRAYQLDGAVNARIDASIFDELVELNEVIRDVHEVLDAAA